MLIMGPTITVVLKVHSNYNMHKWTLWAGNFHGYISDFIDSRRIKHVIFSSKRTHVQCRDIMHFKNDIVVQFLSESWVSFHAAFNAF